MVSRSTTSMIVGSSWLVLISLCCSAWSVDAHLAASNFDFERHLPEEEIEYRDLKSTKKGKGYYQYYGSKGSYYGSKSYYTKSYKKDKDCKSAKKNKNYYGYYDHCFEEETFAPGDGNFTDIDDLVLDEMLVDDAVTETPKSYKSKGSKSGYYTKSEKKDAKKDAKKLFKKDKTDKKSGGMFPRPTPAPVKPVEPKSPDLGFAPDESWNLTFKDAADTGFLFYDSITKYAWYAYNAKVGEGEDSATIGRVCPMDTAGTGRVLEDLCIEIKAPDDWTTVTSTTIQTVEACYGSVTGAIFKIAVVVKDSSKVLHLEDSLVGSRMIVYNIVRSGNVIVAEPIILEVAYEGWKSLYAEPTINGRPAFTPDCKQVYATWLQPDETVAGGYKAITIATDVETITDDGESAELWRLGSRLPGLTSSKDGNTLFSATNVPEGDDLNAGGMVAFNAKTGKIAQEYVYPTNNARLPNNAFTNLVVDDSGNAYHIDSLLGLVKFDLDDLNDGPVWTALEGSTKPMTKDGSRKLAPLVASRDVDSKMLEEELGMIAEDMAFTAFKPALDGKNPTVAYGCGNTASANESDGVVALGATSGESIWFAKFDDIHSVDVGSCSGITHDIVYGPSSASSSGSAVYVGRGKVIQALDSTNGSLLWTFDSQDDGGAAQFVVISEDFVLVANGGTIFGLDTTAPVEPTASPVAVPTDTVPTLPPTNYPTRAPLATPAPFMPNPAPIQPLVATSAPSGGASTAFGASFAIAVSLALPLLAFLR